jgi:RNA 3'-phosphate cyclase
VQFHPGQVPPGELKIDIGTAGSITLLLQAILPPLLFAPGPVHVLLRGGTDVAMSPPWDYFREVIAPALAPLAESAFTLTRRGFYPKGGGEVSMRIQTRFHGDFEALRSDVRRVAGPMVLDAASETGSVEIHSVAHEELRKQEVAERQVAGAREVLRDVRTAASRVEYVRSPSIGTAVTVVAVLKSGARVGGGALGERGKRAESVGRDAAGRLMVAIESGRPVDENLADHLIPWLALRGGSIRTAAITGHTRTNCWVVEQFLGPTFRIDDAVGTITCH